MKYLKLYSQINEAEKVKFFDKNGKLFSSGNGLSSIEQHKKRFGDNITFSVEGYDGVFKTLDEFKDKASKPSNTSLFGDSKAAKERVIAKRNLKEHDIDFVIAKIKEQYSSELVKQMLGDEIEEWIPEGKDVAWYEEHGNGEAQDVVLDVVINWFEDKYYRLSDENFDKVKDILTKEYQL